MQGALAVDRVEGGPAFLHIMADGIDHRVRLLDRPGNGLFVPYVGGYQLDPAVAAEPLRQGCAPGVAHRHADGGALGGQAFDDPAAEESRPAEHGYEFAVHGSSRPEHIPSL